MNWEKQTLKYYDDNPEKFILRTLQINMESLRSRFAFYLPNHAYILDFGCGSGRDTKAFLDSGYRVDAIDGSETICKKASEYTGIPVKRLLFSELKANNTYDGIWACASILHLPKNELIDVLKKMEKALKDQGILYISFKYGTFEGVRDGRYYTDFTEDTINHLLKVATSMKIIDLWQTKETLADGRIEQWINVITRRV